MNFKIAKKQIFIFLGLIFLTACSEDKSSTEYDAKKLIETKCASCHNLDMPPTLSKDEIAPPMMAVAFHVHNFVQPADESQRTPKAIAFVSDYVHNPSLEKSFCDKESLQRYGLMPSQKENLTQGEAEAIASYMFRHFTQENLAKIQEEKAQYEALPEDEKLVITHKCKNCHRINVDITGPSFINIAKKYENQKELIKQSIQNGSTRKWNPKSGAVMPSYANLDDKELEILADWVLKSKERVEK